MGIKITGIEGKSLAAINAEIGEGAKFVYYTFAISIVIMTFRRSSNIHYLPPQTNRVVKGLPYTLLTLVAGWWGIPWGPIYSIGALITNLSGGKDVTEEVLADLHAQAARHSAAPVPMPAPIDSTVCVPG